MKNKKGFTLIELLAVIVILAIIALIAVPVVMNIIAKARKSAAADTAYSILSAAELYYADQLLENPTEAFHSIVFNYETPGAGELAGATNLDTKGTKPTAGKITLDSTGRAYIGEGSGTPIVYNGYLTISGFQCGYAANSTTVIECN